jgi:hypothetical protein
MGVTPAAESTAAAKTLAEKARGAADQHAVRCRLGLYIGGNARHGQSDIGHGKLVGHHRAPS